MKFESFTLNYFEKLRNAIKKIPLHLVKKLKTPFYGHGKKIISSLFLEMAARLVMRFISLMTIYME